jgi:hypothetical protein
MVLVEGLYAALALRICSVNVVIDHNLLHSPLVRYPLIPHLFIPISPSNFIRHNS